MKFITKLQHDSRNEYIYTVQTTSLRVIFFLTAFFSVITAGAATVTSVTSGSWISNSTWDCNCVPGNNDDVIISSGHMVNLPILSSRRVRHLSISSSAMLSMGLLSTLNVRGNYHVDGLHSGNGTVQLAGNGNTLSGTGIITLTTVFQFQRNYTVSSGSQLTWNGQVRINNNRTVSNNGTITINGDLIGQNGSATWVNNSGSVLSVSEDILATGTLQAIAAGNTVNYSGTVAQTIKSPSSAYHHLGIENSGAKQMTAAIVINGNLLLAGGSLSTGGHNLSVGGNWTNTGSNFIHGNGTVSFTGSGSQTLSHLTTENFYNLSMSGSGTLMLESPVLINANLSVTGTLDVSVNSSTITLLGNMTNSGTFLCRQGNVLLNGTTQQLINGASTFYDLTVNNSSGVALQASQQIRGTLQLNAGNFNLGSFDLILVSDASGTGRIGPVTTASISGQITQERYVQPGSTSWRFLCVPVTGQTLNSWYDDFSMSGFPGSHAPTFPFISVYTYDETSPGIKDFGYIPANSINQTLIPGRGYWVYLGPVPLTFDAKGPAVTGNFNFPGLTYTTTSGGIFHDGWNQVGNPYPSGIDWDAAGWLKSNINGAIYIWNSDLQQYTAYVAGIGTNGGSRYVPSSQSFWIQANASGPALSCTEQVKAAVNQTFRNDQADYIRMKLQSGTYQDEAAIRFDPLATDTFDAAFDASKLGSMSTSAPSLYIKHDSLNYSIYSVNWPETVIEIPVYIDVPTNSSCKLSFDTDSFTHKQACILVMDQLSGQTFSPDDEINFNQQSQYHGPRFIIRIYREPYVQVKDVACFGDDDGEVLATGTGAGPWDFTLFNSGGSVQANQLTDTLEVAGLSPDGYTLIIMNSNGCPDDTLPIIIDQPDEMAIDYHASVYCQDKPGTVDLNVTGGCGGYVLQWNDSILPFTQTEAIPGIYTVTVTDSVGCIKSDTLHLLASNPVSASFSYSRVPFESGEKIIFKFTGSGADYLQWNFDDGTFTSEISPVKSFKPGQYLVTLEASNSTCASRVDTMLTISNQVNPTEIIEAYYYDGRIVIASPEPVTAVIYDISGRVVLTSKLLAAGTSTLYTGSPGIAPGTYHCVLTSQRLQKVIRFIN